jgi:hypothetical protein
MSQVIVYTNADGGVSVCYPTGELPIAEVQAKDTPAGSVIVNSATLPNEHNEFFNAWELSGATVSVNMVKAKELTKVRLRMEREPLLAAQDVAFQRAMESNADTSSIVAEKQRLRDITKLADEAVSLSALKTIKAV